MDDILMKVLYIKHDAKFGVLCDNESEMVSHVLGTDLTLVERKKEGKLFILVPLTKAHRFGIHADWLKVDGKRSTSYFANTSYKER